MNNPEPSQSVFPPESPAPLRSIRVLIVEDSKVDAGLVVRELERSGYALTWRQVASAADLKAALAREPWDLVLSDYAMPRFGGLEALEIVKSSGLDLPFILISGSIGEEVAVGAMKAGAHDYLLKDHLTRLASAVARELRDAEDRRARRRAEEAQRVSEEQFRAMFELASIGMAQADVGTGQFLRVNEKLCAITGYSAAEMLKLRVPDITHPEDRDRDWDFFQRVVRGEARDYHLEKRYVRKDHTVIWVSVNISVIRDAAGQPLRTMATIEDISERKRSAEALAAERMILRTLVDHLPVVVYVKDAAARKTLANPMDLRVLGVTSETEALGKTDFDFYPREVAALFHADDQRVLQTGQPLLDHEEVIIRPDGSLCCLLTSKVPLRDATGQVVGLVGIGHDITERRLAETRMREQAALLDATNEAIYVLALDHTIKYWNRGAEQLYGWTNAEAVGRKITELGRIDPAAFEAACAALLKNGSWSGELRITTRMDKPLLMFCRKTLLRDNQNQPKSVLVINTDITEKKQLEANFFRAQRLEGIGALASGIAHDLNNILAPVLMTASLLREATEDADSRAMIDTIQSCAQRGADIIKQLLTFARGKPEARVPLPMRHLLHDMEKIIRETFPRDLRPSLYAPPDLWMVMGDATQLHQALMNLCVNSRDAMPDGGTLTINAKNVIVDEAFAVMTPGCRPGSFVCVSVTDTGAGISPENLDLIFDPFFTTKEIGKGTGLGLATVLGIVRGHEGFVRVASQLGKGTTFEMYFPAAREVQNHQSAGPETPSPRGLGELILVVDDEPTVRESLRRALETHGYRVVTATQGAEGLATFTHHRAEVRAVLTDMMMPVMDGPAMINALRILDPRLPILGMTGLPDRKQIKGIEDLELAAMLNKPFAGDELLRVLWETLQNSARTASPGNTE